jgi:GTP-sensing pleiotropic transcriptional regulator CodY
MRSNFCSVSRVAEFKCLSSIWTAFEIAVRIVVDIFEAVEVGMNMEAVDTEAVDMEATDMEVLDIEAVDIEAVEAIINRVEWIEGRKWAGVETL